MVIPIVSPARSRAALYSRQSARGPCSGKKCACTSISMQGIWGEAGLAQPRGRPYLRRGKTAVRAHLSAVSRRSAMALVECVKKILLEPDAEWSVIASELTNTVSLYRSYILPLAAIAPICGAIGWLVFGVPVPFTGTIRLPLTTALTNAAIMYALSLVMVFLLALVIDALAPSFGGQKNQVQALKVAAYSSTPWWVGGSFTLVPALSIITLVCSLYILYLVYAGLSPLMKSPKDKAVPYTIVIILVAIVLFVMLAAVRQAFLPSMASLGGFTM